MLEFSLGYLPQLEQQLPHVYYEADPKKSNRRLPECLNLGYLPNQLACPMQTAANANRYSPLGALQVFFVASWTLKARALEEKKVGVRQTSRPKIFPLSPPFYLG